MNSGSQQIVDQSGTNFEHQREFMGEEISMTEIIDFFVKNLKLLIVGALFGLLVGVASWIWIVPFKAELVITNTTNTTKSPFDYITWRKLQKNLPNLASELIEDGLVSGDKLSVYEGMSDEAWWHKNVVPTYALTKADTKELATLGKDLDDASTQILNIVLSSSGKTKETALSKIQIEKEYLLSGSAYLQIKDLLNSYDNEASTQRAIVEKQITSQKIELDFLNQRLENLEKLRARFPANSVVGAQVVDPKDSGAKYLPLATQIIAVNTDINNLKEGIHRNQNQLKQFDLNKLLLADINPLLVKSSNGIELADKVLAIQESYRSKLDDVVLIESLDKLRSEITAIKSLFSQGLVSNVSPSVVKKGMIKYPAIGFFIGVVFAILAALLLQSAKLYQDQKSLQVNNG